MEVLLTIVFLFGLMFFYAYLAGEPQNSSSSGGVEIYSPSEPDHSAAYYNAAADRAEARARYEEALATLEDTRYAIKNRHNTTIDLNKWN